MKAHSVIIRGGSGCLFQPMTDEYTYIFTAKHVFLSDSNNPDSLITDDCEITKFTNDGMAWRSETITYKPVLGDNYFPHEKTDLVLLKIPYQQNLSTIYIQDYFHSETTCKLCGFPKALEQNSISDRYTFHNINNFIASGDYCYTAQLDSTLTQENIEGMSGGGILRLFGEDIFFVGIQSKMATANISVQAGQIAFIPVKYIHEILDYPWNIGKLCKLHPPFYQNFAFLKDDSFNIKPGIEQKDVVDSLTEVLRSHAQNIINNNITPLSIRENLGERLLYVINKQTNTDLEKKKIWIVWLELLTILNIAKDKRHTNKDLKELFKTIRLIYSDTDEDFWVKHIEDLLDVDYAELEEKGLVVVASNCPAISMHVFDPSKILPTINRCRNKYEIQSINIDNPSGFPFEKYRFANISAFKEDTIVNKYSEFINMNITCAVKKLKELYERLVN